MAGAGTLVRAYTLRGTIDARSRCRARKMQGFACQAIAFVLELGILLLRSAKAFHPPMGTRFALRMAAVAR
jgi:uncharacterized protein YigA (DUF484 family)